MKKIKAPTTVLSPREKQTLLALAEGLTIKDFMARENLAYGTVKKYCHMAKKKLKARNLPNAVARAVATGIICPQLNLPAHFVVMNDSSVPGDAG